MNVAAYTINPLSGLINHWGQIATVNLDSIESEHLQLLSQITAGVYFETLADTLEEVQNNLPSQDATNRQILDKAIRDLLYLQKRYEIL